ncbi:hypothetical protein FRB99_006702 [Tulasnella sp. 403]|nr:hypothetical protein FRB99_006702 [Tulasnella sp. 403]
MDRDLEKVPPNEIQPAKYDAPLTGEYVAQKRFPVTKRLVDAFVFFGSLCLGWHLASRYLSPSPSRPCALQTDLTVMSKPYIASPDRPLVWGDVNIIHTSDSHGWLLGHQKASEPEPNASGTFGDFYSFVHHMKRKAARQGVDLLVVDSGDLHDGNGLSDGFPEGGVNGHETNKFFTKIPYDALAIGNHELYKYPVSLDVYRNFAPKWKGRYLTSNVNITIVSKDGTTKKVPIGAQYTKFKTSQGRTVTAFGVLFNFTNNAKNTHVQKADDFVKESWFLEAIAEEPDFFLLLGDGMNSHMAVARDNWPIIFKAIRYVHPFTPILIFGGHTHIRDCVVLDERSMALESGRYMETVGWMSATLPKVKTDPVEFSRRYLDANRVTYQYHTGTSEGTFDTRKGKKITKGLKRLVKRFNLDSTFGVVPQDYYLDRVPHTFNNSVVSLFIHKILPTVLPASYPERASTPFIVVANSGSQRFDVFRGPFTRNDQFIVSPFKNSFLYLTVPLGIGRKVADKLNEYGAFSTFVVNDEEAMVTKVWTEWRKQQWENMQPSHMFDANGKQLTLGYRTTDSCPGGPGDDTPHSPIPFFDAPGYVAHSTVPPATPDTSLVDIIIMNFFVADTVKAVNDLRAEYPELMVPGSRNVTVHDVKTYGKIQSNEVFGMYAQMAWSKKHQAMASN